MANEPNLEDKGTSPETAVQQQGDRSWPVPGDEGYVHPDGTPQSIEQLANNRRAAADRAAAGSIIHGAPAAHPGPQLQAQADAAAARAEAYSGPTPDEARAGVTKHVREGLAKAAEDNPPADDAPSEPNPDGAKRTATTTGGKRTA